MKTKIRSIALKSSSDFGDEVSLDIDTDALVNAGVQAGGANVKAIAASIATGASVGALFGTAIPIPVIGTISGAVIGAVVGFIAGILPSIDKALSKQCTITIAGLDTDCSDYPQNVKGCIEWVQANIPTAVTMSPDQLADQTHVLPQDFIVWFNTPPVGDWADFHQRVLDTKLYDSVLKKLPGTQTILRSVQIPAAAAIASATPELINVYAITFQNTFPALTADDIFKIVAKVRPILDAKVQVVANWIKAQSVYPTREQAHSVYHELALADIERAFALAPESAKQTFMASSKLKRVEPKRQIVGKSGKIVTPALTPDADVTDPSMSLPPSSKSKNTGLLAAGIILGGGLLAAGGAPIAAGVLLAGGLLTAIFGKKS